MAKNKKTKSQPQQSDSIDLPEKKNTGFCYWEGNVLVLNVLGTPSAKTDKIGKPKGSQLKISVKAAPRAGKATDYMVNFLSDEFDVKTSAIEVVFGRMNINKQLRITAPQQLPSVIERFLAKKS
ncbi:MAG: DUF167 domain-containing protein [Ghiorsea sp.]